MPSLKPFFQHFLDITHQRSDLSGRNFQKIQGRESGVHVHISTLGNDTKNSHKGSRMNEKEIRKTTELRMSTETDLEFGQLPTKPSSTWSLPERGTSVRDHTRPAPT